MTPTKEQVLKSAAISPEAKKALVELFPDYFESEYCRVDEETVDMCSESNPIKDAAKQIAPKVNPSFMNVMDWTSYSMVINRPETNRRSFLLSLDDNTKWEIKEVNNDFGSVIQILCPVEYKQKH